MTMDKTDLFFIFLLVVISVIFWLPTVNIPYWWDSAGYIMHTASQFLETDFNPLVAKNEYSDFAHPPLFPFILALMWKIFGESLLASHFLNLIFVFLLFFYTYLLGKELVKDKIIGDLIGFFAGIILFFTPVFLAQLGIIYVEIPLALFALMTVYYAIKKNVIGYLIASSLMVLTKEVSVFVILAVLSVFSLNEIFTAFKKKEKFNFIKLLKEVFIFSIPVFIVFLWFFYHKIVSGWWFIVPGARGLNEVAAISFNKIKGVFSFLFLGQWRFLAALSVVYFSFLIFLKKDFKKYLLKPEISLIFLIPIFTALFFGITEFLHRYVIIALPFFYLFFFYVLASAFAEEPLKQRAAILGWAALFLSVFFYLSWDNHRRINSFYFSPLEDNLEYLNIIEIGKKTTGFIEKNYPDASVYTSFPVNYMLSEPFQGYVSKPIKTYECNKYEEGDKVDLIVLHLFSPGEIACKKITEKLGFSSLVIFEKNGKWMQVLFK